MVDSPASSSAVCPESSNGTIRKLSPEAPVKVAKERRKSRERDAAASDSTDIEMFLDKNLTIDGGQSSDASNLSYVDALPPEILIKLKKNLREFFG